MEKRLLSLDVFRGLTIASMILVNNPGDWNYVYKPLLHAKWNGLTPTDLVFPFFLFIMGVSISLAFTVRLQKQNNPITIYRKIALRTISLFGLGIILNLLPNFNFQELRVAGVLQRISIVYLVCALVYLNSGWKTQAITNSIILLLYWLAIRYIPTPGFASPIMEPGKNLAAWIDTLLLPGRMWQGTWDPEGIFSTLPAIATGISGMLAGRLITTKLPLERKVIWLFLIGFLSCCIGYCWSWIFPFNKNLWTSSYVLFTAGLASLFLASLIFLIDILEIRNFSPFCIPFGRNAIIVYVLSDLIAILLCQVNIHGLSANAYLMNTLTGLGLGNKLSSLCFALLCIGINFLPAYWLYKRKILIKL
jgi:predicted acyltransferase